MKRVGLLGGSFNPAHRGHRLLSLAALRALELDEVWWLVSPGNPLKDGSDMAPYEARLASAKAAARGAPIRVSDFERDAGTRYTVDTVRQLTAQNPHSRFVWLMGMDTLPNFHLWKEWRALARLVPIAVLPRPGYDAAARAARAMGWLRGFVRPSSQARQWTQWSPPAILFLRLPTDRTSATALRALDPNWHSPVHPHTLGTQRRGITPNRRRPLARSSR
jgi:nicotinate-nucleotide adenylyltransferase